jgi:hypothetical protein
LWERHCADQTINPDNQPSVFYGHMRDVRHIDLMPNLQANLMMRSHGFLSHRDIKAMGRAQVTALFPSTTPDHYEIGKWVNIVADGKNVKIERLEQ